SIVAQKQGLPKDTAIKVFDMKNAAEDQAKSVRADKSLSEEQRTQALQGIRSETERSIEEVFGKTGFQSYQKQPTAHWLKSISPDPK
ncbi:MAG: hypothetical protein M3Y82_06965, partial [Verrucomicrobiota bacterium]|nr:hypothetical protein [Verrucomicrobiota bacterium]